MPPYSSTNSSMLGNAFLSSRFMRPKSSCTLFWTGVPARVCARPELQAILLSAYDNGQLFAKLPGASDLLSRTHEINYSAHLASAAGLPSDMLTAFALRHCSAAGNRLGGT